MKAEKTLTRGPATELIHAGEVNRTAVTPLTTPIYETTTFVFDSAEEVVAYNEGRSSKHLYSRYTNPTIIAAEQKLAAIDRAEAALLVRVANQSDAALRRRQADRRRLPRARRPLGDRQHVCEPDQPAAARARRRSRDAERDQVSERAQRRDRREGGGEEGARGADREGAAAARHRHGSASGVRARARPEDAAAPSRAAQRQ